MKKEKSDLVSDFKEGDFLYGLEDEARAHCYGDVFSQLVESQAKYTFVTIDEINSELAPIFFKKQYTMSPLRECKTPVRNHGAFLLSQEAFHPRTPEDLPGSEQKLRYKQLRSCLAGITDCPGKIRFCLDGLEEFDKVRNPDYIKEYNSYTSNELRYIAHNFNDFKDKIVFYLKGIRVDSPWVEDGQSPEEWLDSYGSKAQLLSPTEFQYTTPVKSKRSRADMIRDLLQPQTKCPKFDDENSPSTCLP